MVWICTWDKTNLLPKWACPGRLWKREQLRGIVLTKGKSWTSFSCSALSVCQRGRAELHWHFTYLFVLIPTDPFSMMNLPVSHTLEHSRGAFRRLSSTEGLSLACLLKPRNKRSSKNCICDALASFFFFSCLFPFMCMLCAGHNSKPVKIDVKSATAGQTDRRR